MGRRRDTLCEIHRAPLRQALCGFALALVVTSALPAQEPRAVAPAHARLLHFKDAEGREVPVRSPDDWRRRRHQILEGMQLAMGRLPDRSSLPPFDVRQDERVEGDRYTRLRITFAVEENDRLSAYLYVPRPLAARVRFPAMLALHPTSPLGKGVPAGLSSRPNRAYALELARRGYVVLAPDYPSFGDYAYDFSKDRYSSGTMKGIFNHMRCVDYLLSRDDVDPERVGVIGHSLGGHNAMFVGVFDERLKVIVASCGWTPFHDYYGGKIKGWTSDRYMPRLETEYGLDPDRVPFDFYEVVAALAPRAFFSCSPLGDDNFAVAGVMKAIRAAREIYALVGAPERLAVRYPDAGHDFPLGVRLEAYDFIDAALAHRPPVPPAPDERLRAGVAVVDITPPRGWRMSGYFHERLNTGTHDPLLAKTLYLAQGDEEVAMVFCDLVGVSPSVAEEARHAAVLLTGIPRRGLLIAATHSHTGPLYFGALREHFHHRAVAANGKDVHEPVDYARELASRLVEVVARAQGLASPATLAAGTARETRLSFNRRFHMKAGGVRFNPGKLNPDIVRPAGPIDPDVGLLVLREPRSGRATASLTVFALHLDTVGGSEYSADFPYHLERALRADLGGDFVSLFGAGACGDINHIDVSHDRPQKGHGEAERIGTALAESVRAAMAGAGTFTPRLRARSATVAAPLQRFTPEEHAQALRDLEKIGGRELSFLEQVRAYKIVAVARRPSSLLPMEVQAFRLGDELAIVGLPGEVFVDLALAVKKASPFETTIVIELSNDAPGYIPTRKAFAEGSYETVNSRVASGGGELLVETALRLLEELGR